MTQNEAAYQHLHDSAGFSVRALPDRWNNELLEISRRSPVKAGNISIHFDRSPDIFTIPKFTSYRYRLLGFFHDEQLIGFATASYQKRYIRGVVTDVIYLGNMHVTVKGTGRIFLKKLAERVVEKVKNRPEVKYLYAYVMEGNRAAKRLVDLGQQESKPAGTIFLSTIFTIKPVRLSRKYSVRKAVPGDIDKIAELMSREFREQFLAPELNRDIFMHNLKLRPGVDIDNYYVALRDEKIIGACLAWDMTAFKKNRVYFHGLKMNLVSNFYNLLARLSGSPLLPRPGEPFRDVTIAEHAVIDRDPEVMEALLRFIYHEYRENGYHSVIFGCSSGDPILKATKPFLSREVRSAIVIAPLQKGSEHIFRDNPMIYADAIQI
jgi:hypothetical protein